MCKLTVKLIFKVDKSGHYRHPEFFLLLHFKTIENSIKNIYLLKLFFPMPKNHLLRIIKFEYLKIPLLSSEIFLLNFCAIFENQQFIINIYF